MELKVAQAHGRGEVQFSGGAKVATLKIDSADTPSTGKTFANVLFDFDSTSDVVDLTSFIYTSGATAAVSGSVLKLTDGGNTVRFTLGGSSASAYSVVQDASRGTLIIPLSNQAQIFVQAMASLHLGVAAPEVSPSYGSEPRTIGVLAAAHI